MGCNLVRAFSGRGDGQQTKIDFGGKLTAGAVPDRIRRGSRDESAKGRWFERLFMQVKLQKSEFEIGSV